MMIARERGDLTLGGDASHSQRTPRQAGPTFTAAERRHMRSSQKVARSDSLAAAADRAKGLAAAGPCYAL
jgi:hypothetical protein